MKLSLVIPCYNEESAIPVVLNKIHAWKTKVDFLDEIIVVNDGSTDQSIELLKCFPEIKVISHSSSKGYGAALKTGFRATNSPNAIAFMDMDDTYQADDFTLMWQRFLTGQFDIVYGNRLKEQSGMPFVRSLGNTFYAICLKILSPRPLKDPCTGMRIFSRTHLETFTKIKENDLSYSMALSMIVLMKKMNFLEVPISYEERIGESKLLPAKDGVLFLYSLLKYRFLNL